jgi:hypothetical protein
MMVTFESDAERFTVFLADARAGFCMALEDGLWWSEHVRWN